MRRAIVNRRRFVTMGAGAVGALTAGPNLSGARELGAGRRPYGDRSSFETTAQSFNPSATPGTGSSRTPLQDLHGIITPSSLHFERHHSGVPAIDPKKHQLLIDGLVKERLVFSIEDLLRLPSVSRIHFIECAGNSGREHEGSPAPDAQKSHGLLSCSEWTGVPLKVLLDEAGIASSARWVVAEGADACRLNRSLPLEKAFDDALVVYGQNGEALRPEQGYPLRLLVPGWEGNVNVKWLSRLRVVTQPDMSREESAAYTDFMPDGSARRFSFVMEAKSVITRPSGGQSLHGPGFYDITGLAWSGRGRFTRVAVSTNAGATWTNAQLNEPVLSKALTRFTFPWSWDGKNAVLQSRCVDETGYDQPTREQLIAVRGLHPGPDGFNHYNGIKQWFVSEGGQVSHV